MRRIFIYIILIISLTACKVKTKPSEINLEIPEKEIQSADNLKKNKIRIDTDGHYYLNNNQVMFDSIIQKIDSLGTLGFDASSFIIRADKKVNVSETIKIMELGNSSNKKFKLGTSTN